MAVSLDDAHTGDRLRAGMVTAMILPFELDPQIIHHIIYSQAGSIGKALIELIMNSVDAGATTVTLCMTQEGFTCSDDGQGFASRDDVVRYFGRFGTPHQEGDATYGRFRLGRGQIMAHASTEWCSKEWRMQVDTRSMGYSYHLDELQVTKPGCHITGHWYELLSEGELKSAEQEIRDLVRYTGTQVLLNGRVITRNPKAEPWDFEDENAYYRAKAEGAVSIYNQGVLVRHDATHVWGAGGLIVSKKAIGLNVSRTEILRKTCPVWKAIAKTFAGMAEAFMAKLGDHRKTEARREKFARALLSGDENLLGIYEKEQVITVLPGKRHMTLRDFLFTTYWQHKMSMAIVENHADVPRGEVIAKEGLAMIVHPQTLERFGACHPEEFREALERATADVAHAWQQRHGRGQVEWLRAPAVISFAALREAFHERTRVVSETDALDKETRRAWRALRCCLQYYVAACRGAQMTSRGRIGNWREERGLMMRLLLGDSNAAEAWTDGATYIAIDQRIVKKLKSDPLKTASYIFSLVEHEIAHQGDSLDCGHDEAFYQRYHDISIEMAAERQRYIHIWLMKYTASMETEGRSRHAASRAWAERYLVDRVGTGRIKRGLSAAIDSVAEHPIMTSPIPEESMAFVNAVNAGLIASGAWTPPDRDAVLAAAADAHVREAREQCSRTRDEALISAALTAEIEADCRAIRQRFADILGVSLSDLCEDAIWYFVHFCDTDEHVKEAWADKEWERLYEANYSEPDDDEIARMMLDEATEPHPNDEPPTEDDVTGLWRVAADCRGLVNPGETWWSLERNAAAAGFYQVDDYLRWRAAAAA